MMKRGNMSLFLDLLEKWWRDEVSFHQVEAALGDATRLTREMLIENGIANFDGTCVQGFPFQYVVNLVLLFLAMRRSLTSVTSS